MTDGEWEIRGPDGTEYEELRHFRRVTGEIHHLEVRPKRKQTGWKCHAYINWQNRDSACCYTCVTVQEQIDVRKNCVYGHDRPCWQPFYGKVVE